MKLQVDNGAVLAYRRLSYRPWYAIAEFVDNSTDAYFRVANRHVLDEEYETTGSGLEVEVVYDRKQGLLRVTDNSIGMSMAELEDAMVIGRAPNVSAGRSEFGMGMKTAAIWFADKIEIRTKKLNEPEEIRVILDVQDFVQGNAELSLRTTPKPLDQHYTIVELGGLIRRLGPSALDKTRKFLASIYRQDLRAGVLKLTVNGEEVEAPPSSGDDAFVKRSDGTPYVLRVEDVTVSGRKVSGWIGVLRPGFTGRNQAGFALVRHGRAVRGWLDSWRPEEIFGDARNDRLNQRLTGELTMDDFRASHTKDAIDWENDDEEELGTLLKKLCTSYDLIRVAQQNNSSTPSPESELEGAEARARLAEQMNSAIVSNEIRVLDVPKPELAKLANEVLISSLEEFDAAEDAVAVASWDIGEGRTALLYEVPCSPNDPYYEYEVLENTDLRIVINANHPALVLIPGTEARLAHYHHVALDAIAEWKCTQMQEPIHPESIRVMKDRLFRALVKADDVL